MLFALDAIMPSCADLVKILGSNKKQESSNVQAASRLSSLETQQELSNNIWITFWSSVRFLNAIEKVSQCL